MKDTGKIVTLMRFSEDGEANLYKSLLESAGINAALSGEYVNDIYPMGNSWAGIRLEVAAEDAEKAREILSAKFDRCEFEAGTAEDL